MTIAGKPNRSSASKKAIPPKQCSAMCWREGTKLPDGTWEGGIRVQCKKMAIVGGTVCNTHGGAAPVVREAARRRILRVADDALTGMMVLAGIEGSGLGAESEAVRQRALADLLDRAGLKPTDKVEVTENAVTNEALDEQISRALESRGGGTGGRG